VRHDGHVAIEHGLQPTPDVVFVEVAQRGGVETERRIFRNIAARAESTIFPLYLHAAHICIALNALKNRA
jgi:hypothetical protein